MVMSAGSLTQGQPMATRNDHYVLRIFETLKRSPSRPVVYWRDEIITAGKLHDAILDAAAALRRAGVDATRPLAILTEPNHPDMLIARYAAHLLGAPVVHIRSMNPRSDAETFSLAVQLEILRDTEAKVLLVDDAHADRGKALSAGVAGLTVLHGLDRGFAETPWFGRYVPDALAVIDFTSGSTSSPKMVKQLFGIRESLIDLLATGLERGLPATLLSVTPISHTTAPMVDAVLTGGGSIVLHEGFDADDVLRAIAEQGVTDVYLACPHLYRLLDHPGVRDADISSLRRITYSGTPAAPARVAQAVEVFGDVLIQVYGTTEAGGITSLNPMDHREPELLGSVGRPFPWVRLELRDPETHVEVERGQVGEVWVRSATVMDGYLGEQGLTSTALLDGWLRTGDLGHWDKYGYLRLVGRVGNVIKSGGLKLDPASIERTLLAHPQVKYAIVYGIRDEEYVEHVHAAVELRNDECTTDELRAHVAHALTPTHVPADITVWDELPLNGSGKPDLAYLRNRKGAP